MKRCSTSCSTFYHQAERTKVSNLDLAPPDVKKGRRSVDDRRETLCS